jgi:hypothetical protein
MLKFYENDSYYKIQTILCLLNLSHILTKYFFVIHLSLCGLVVRVSANPEVPGSIPGTARFSE